MSLARYTAKRLALPMMERAGVLRLLRAVDPSQGRVCLNYHNVDPGLFAQHADYLARHTRVVGLEEFLDPRPVVDDRPVVALTFDDGYASFAEDVMPVLARHRLPAAWFVVSGMVDTGDVFWFDRVRLGVLAARRDHVSCGPYRFALRLWNRETVAASINRFLKQSDPAARPGLIAGLLAQTGEAPPALMHRVRIVSRCQLQAVDSALVTVGSHSHSHPQLSQLDETSLDDELAVSKRLLEGWLDREVVHFAFPSGDYSGTTVAAVARAGYRYAWTTEPRFASTADPAFVLPRVSVDDHASVAILSARLTRLFAGW
jgi:peptidoglycan/xylan/chitin deacetylase (PgdA/CDA1 family)